ncbi:MAG: CaiB/BaiF CoA-transferase family protein [Pseudomonadota bacterium]|nr:CaiB/BaiF CoA-transferase family protein [Pseudomonadota bacterium]
MKPLENIRVLDFTRVLAGPTCTRILAELGAQVTKVEPPSGDIGRIAAPQIHGQSAYYLQLNGGKRNLSIDLNWPEAREAVLRLCHKADVIVENFRPGTMKTFGLDYESVRQQNPAVVYVSMSGYGQNTPWSTRPAFAPTVQAESGATQTQIDHFGDDLLRPVTDWASHADVYTGLEGAIAVLAGLNKRNATGTGLHGDVSMMATMLAVNERLHAQINELDATDEPLALGAPESPIFKVADGSFVTIAASPISSGVFMRYCGMMGRNDLRTDSRFATPELRRKNLKPLLDEVQNWMRSFRSFEELEYQVSSAGGLAVGKVRTAADLLETDWAKSADPTYTSLVGEHEIRLPKGPWLFNGRDTGALSTAAPRGANNREVLSEAGFDDATLRAWEDAGILSSDL